MTKISLSSREKILVYILSLVLIVFLYVSFVRDTLSNEVNASNFSSNGINHSTYMEIKELHDDFSLELESMKITKDKIDLYHNDFGKLIDTKTIAEEKNLELKNISISPINKGEIDDVEVFYVQSITRLEGSLGNILEYLKEVKQNEKLFVENISLNRIDKEKLFLEIALREYTLKEVPYSGIVSKNNNDANSEDSSEDFTSLIDSIYGNKAESENEDTENNRNTPKVKSSFSEKGNDKLKSNEVIDSNKAILNEENTHNEGSTVVTTMITEDKIKNYNNFLKINDNMSSIIDQSFLNNYLLNWDVNLIIDSNYFDKNYIRLKNNPNVLNNFFIDSETSEFTLFIDGVVDLNNTPIVINKPKDLIVFEFDGNVGSKILFDCKTSSEDIVVLEGSKKIDGWQIIEFTLPVDSNMYPLGIISFKCIDKAGNNSGFIKNLATIEKK